MSGITIVRRGSAACQSTIWDDGVLRFDGLSGPRLGAWQSRVPGEWFAHLRELVMALPKTSRSRAQSEAQSEWDITHDLWRSPKTHGVSADLDDASWRLVTSFQGVLTLARWAPLDDSGRVELSGFACATAVEFRQARVLAEGLANRQGLLVLAGSVASTSTSESLESTYKALRETLFADGSLILVDDHYLLNGHLFFDTPSAAASVMAGSNTNGRVKWTDKFGRPWASLGFD